MAEDGGVREGLRRVPRRRRPATRVKGEVTDDDENNENSPMIRNSADAAEIASQARTGGSDDARPKVRGSGDEVPERDAEPQSSQNEVKDSVALPRAGNGTRNDTAKDFLARQKQLERVSAVNMPEVHCLGQLLSCRDVAIEEGEGVSCRWKVEFDKAWQHLEGDLVGQTHYSYPRIGGTGDAPLNHPLDLHFSEAGLHVRQ